MTIFSLGNACDLAQFTNNTKLDSLGDVDRPVVPMPTDPPSFGDTKYQWESESKMTRDMTTRDVHSNTFQPMVGQDSQDWGAVQNYGGDYWGENTVNYDYPNPMLNQPNSNIVAPNMRQQGAHMPTSRSHIVTKEDFNGRDKEEMVRRIVAEARKKQVVEEEVIQEDPKENILNSQKSAWVALIVIFFIVIFAILYRSRFF